MLFLSEINRFNSNFFNSIVSPEACTSLVATNSGVQNTMPVSNEINNVAVVQFRLTLQKNSLRRTSDRSREVCLH